MINLINSIDFDDNDQVEKNLEYVTISYFDHRLAVGEESPFGFMWYGEAKEDDKKLLLFNSISNCFLNFYLDLYRQEEEGVVAFVRNKLKIIRSRGQYKSIVTNAMKESPLCSFVFRLSRVFMDAGFDLTHRCYVDANDPNKEAIKSRVVKIAKDNHLHLLPPVTNPYNHLKAWQELMANSHNK